MIIAAFPMLITDGIATELEEQLVRLPPALFMLSRNWLQEYVDAVLKLHESGATVLCTAIIPLLDELVARGVNVNVVYPSFDSNKNYLELVGKQSVSLTGIVNDLSNPTIWLNHLMPYVAMEGVNKICISKDCKVPLVSEGRYVY